MDSNQISLCKQQKLSGQIFDLTTHNSPEHLDGLGNNKG